MKFLKLILALMMVISVTGCSKGNDGTESQVTTIGENGNSTSVNGEVVSTPEEATSSDVVDPLESMTEGEILDLYLVKKRDLALLSTTVSEYLLALEIYNTLVLECKNVVTSFDKKGYPNITVAEEKKIRETINVILDLDDYFDLVDVLASTQRYSSTYGMGVTNYSLNYAIKKANQNSSDAAYRYLVVTLMQGMDSIVLGYNKELVKNLEAICDEYVDDLDILKDDLTSEIYNDQCLSLAQAYFNIAKYEKCLEVSLKYFEETKDFGYYAMAMNAALNLNDGATIEKITKEYLTLDDSNVVANYYGAIGGMFNSNYNDVVTYATKLSDELENDENLLVVMRI